MKTYSRSVKSPCSVREQNLPDEYENSCRLCLTKDNIMIDIYNEDEIVPIPLKLRYCISLEVSEEDGLPCGICTDCMVKLDETYAFKKRCLATDVKLRQFIQVPSFSNTFTVDEPTAKENTLVENPADTNYSRDACTIKMEDNALLFINAFCRSSPSNKITTNNNNIGDIESNNIEVTGIDIGDNVNAYATTNENDHLNIDDYCTDNGNCDKGDTIEELEDDLISQNVVETRRSARISLNKSKIAESTHLLKSFQGNELGDGEREEETADEGEEEGDEEFTNSSGKTNSSSGRKLGKATYRCTPCNITFHDYKELLCHKHTHHAETIKMCSFCPKTFVTNSTLQRHLRIHTGDRPYACTHCGKRFSQKEILNRHSVVHSLNKEKNTKCNICNYSCNSTEQLHKHVKTRHTDNANTIPKYQCNKCSKTFHHPSGLSRHQAVHSGIVYQCISCIKPFSDKSSVRRHFFKSHADPIDSYKNNGSVKYYQIATFQY